jgi:endonuclease/exonuclease/phosphatase family metal-dependent hydrolase
LWRIQTQGDFFSAHPTPASTVAYDFVQILVDDLAARGLNYKPVATATNLDVELPDGFPFGAYSDVRLTDRDVILARADQPASQLKVSNARSGEFDAALPFGVGGFTVNVTRGWTSVDAQVRGKSYHVVESHTETASLDVQLAQIGELLAGPAGSALPTVLIGDFNSDANVPEPGYQLLAGDGFSDAWTATHGTDPGLTWGHSADLRDAVPSFTQRLDLVMFRNGVGARDMNVLDGAAPATATGPLWASDHAGVVATLAIGSQSVKHEQTPTADKLDLFSKKKIDADAALLLV